MNKISFSDFYRELEKPISGFITEQNTFNPEELKEAEEWYEEQQNGIIKLISDYLNEKYKKEKL